MMMVMDRMPARRLQHISKTLSLRSIDSQYRWISVSYVRLQKKNRSNLKPQSKTIIDKSNRNSSFDLFIKRLIEEKGIEPGVSATPESSPSASDEFEGAPRDRSGDFDVQSKQEEKQEPRPQILTPPLFILAGSSNMGGRGRPDKLPEDIICPHTYEKNAPLPTTFGTIDFRMCYSIDSHLTPRGGSSSSHHFVPLKAQTSICGQRVGPEFGIAKALGSRLTMHTQQAYFLKYTLDQSNLHRNWHPRNTQKFGHQDAIGHFKSFIEFCKRHTLGEFRKAEASGKQPRYQLAGIFWLQGEKDADVKEYADSYLENFQLFVKSVRYQLNAPDLPFVVSPIVGDGPFVERVNQQLRLAGSGAVPHCFCIDSLSPRFRIRTKGLEDHCPRTAGITDIGKRMAATMPLEDVLVSKS